MAGAADPARSPIPAAGQPHSDRATAATTAAERRASAKKGTWTAESEPTGLAAGGDAAAVTAAWSALIHAGSPNRAGQAGTSPAATAPEPALRFWDRLDADVRAELIRAGRARSYEPGMRLYRQGDPAGEVFVIRDGWVKVTVADPAGSEATLQVYGPGDLVGVQAPADSEHRQTVTALTGVHVLCVPGLRFQQLTLYRPSAAGMLQAVLLDRLADSERRRTAMMTATVQDRVTGLLSELVLRCGQTGPDGVTIPLPLSQDDLASWAGTSPAVLARVLRELRQAGVLATGRRTFTVVHPSVRAAYRDRQARAAADAEMVALLAKDGFTGRNYAAFEEQLAGYGFAVLQAWLRTGEIFARCARRGLPLAQPPQPLTPEDRSDLATDTLVPGLRDFRQRALIDGRWDPAGGASLTTYFIGGLLPHFANAYRGWLRGKQRQPREESLAVLDDRPGSSTDDPQMVAVARRTVIDAIADLDDLTARIVVLKAYGYRNDEIAEIENVSPRAVEGRLARHRRSLLEAHDSQADSPEHR